VYRQVLEHLVMRCQLVDESDEFAAAAAAAAAASGGGDGSDDGSNDGTGGWGGHDHGSGGDGGNGSGSTMKLCVDEDELEEAYDLLGDFLKEIDRDQILPPFQAKKVVA
jgi:hypothetical protein